jgi:hypothetical protein
MPDTTAATPPAPPSQILSPGGTVMLPGVGDSGITPSGQQGANSNFPTRQQIDAAKEAGIPVDRNIEERRRQEDEKAEEERKEREYQEKNKQSINPSAASIENPTADQEEAVKAAKDAQARVQQQAQEEINKALQETLASASDAYDKAKANLGQNEELTLTKDEFMAQVTAEFGQKATQYNQDVMKSFLSGGPVATFTPTAAGYAQTQLAPYIRDGQVDIQAALMSGDFTNTQLTQLLSKAGVENAEDAVKAGNARLSNDTATLERMGLMTYTYPGIAQTFKSRDDFDKYVSNLSQEEKERLGLLVWTIPGVNREFSSKADMDAYWSGLSNDDQVRLAKANGWPVTEIAEGGSVIRVQGIDRDFGTGEDFDAYWKGLSNEEQVRIARLNDWPVTETKAWAIPGIDKTFDSQEATEKYWDGLSPEVQLSIAKDNGWPVTYTPAEGGAVAESLPGVQGIQVKGVDATFDSEAQFNEYFSQLPEARRLEVARLNDWPTTIKVKGVDATFDSEAQFQEYFDQLSPERQVAIAKLNGWSISETTAPTKQTFSIPGIDKQFDTEAEAQVYFANLSPSVQEEIARDNGWEITYTQTPLTPTRGIGSNATGDALTKWMAGGMRASPSTVERKDGPIAKMNATIIRSRQPYSKYIDLAGNFDVTQAVQDGVNETKLRDYLIKGGVQNAEQVISDTKTMLTTTVVIKTGERVDADFYGGLSKYKQQKLNQLGVDNFNLSERSAYDREVTAVQRIEGQLSPYIIGRDKDDNPQYDLSKLVDDRLVSDESEAQVVKNLGPIFGASIVKDTIAVNKAIKTNDMAELERRGLVVFRIEGVARDFKTNAEWEAYWTSLSNEEQVRLAELNKWKMTETTIWHLPGIDKAFASKEEAEAYAIATATASPAIQKEISKIIKSNPKYDGAQELFPWENASWRAANAAANEKTMAQLNSLVSALKGEARAYAESFVASMKPQPGMKYIELGPSQPGVYVPAKADFVGAAKATVGIIPIIGTAVYWKDMTPTGKAVSIAFDALVVMPTAKGLRATGKALSTEKVPYLSAADLPKARAYADVVNKAEGYRTASLKVERIYDTIGMRKPSELLAMAKVADEAGDIERAQALYNHATNVIPKLEAQLPSAVRAREVAAIRVEKAADTFKASGAYGWGGNLEDLPKDLGSDIVNVLDRYAEDVIRRERLAKYNELKARYPNDPSRWAEYYTMPEPPAEVMPIPSKLKELQADAQRWRRDYAFALAEGDVKKVNRLLAERKAIWRDMEEFIGKIGEPEPMISPGGSGKGVVTAVRTNPVLKAQFSETTKPSIVDKLLAEKEGQKLGVIGIAGASKTTTQGAEKDVYHPDYQTGYPTPETEVDSQPYTVTTIGPTVTGTPVPFSVPAVVPTTIPTISPSVKPTIKPSVRPDIGPEILPSTRPEIKPGTRPDVRPNIRPDIQPNIRPGTRPEIKPNVIPEIKPEIRPTTTPSIKPATKPTTTPSVRPQTTPSTTPSISPGTRPVVTPTIQPTVTPKVTPQIKPAVKPAVKIQVKADIRTATRIDLKASTRPAFNVRVSPETKPQSKAQVKTKTRLATKLREEVSEKGPKGKGGFKLPGGKELPPGVYPRKVKFPLGKSKVGVDIDTRAINYSRNTGDPKQKPQAGFKVVTTDKTKPKPQRFPQGIVDMVVTEDEIKFELNKTRHESTKSMIRRLRKEGKL